MANIGDIIFLMGIALMIGIIVLISMYVNNQIMASPVVNNTFTTQQKSLATISYNTVSMFDYLAVFIVFGIGLVGVISALYIHSNAVFFIFMIILQAIVIAVSTVFSNIWYSIATTTQLVTQANKMTYTTIIFNNLPLIILGFTAMVGIVSYGVGKRKVSGYAD
jgi:fatty acid desaturase